MTRISRSVLVAATLAGQSVVAQRPIEFKANVSIVDGNDGTTSTGVMYFGGAKTRTELSKDGQSIVLLADHSAKSQLILMADEKMYMQFPLGQGPVSIPLAGPSDPTNPCSGGSGATDCVKGATESVNGYQTVRWDYTNPEGTRTRSWVSTKLRFPVKTEDDNGGKMEMTNIAEGPQSASLFSVPAGYTQMDMGATGGLGGGRGRGRGRANGDPIAAAMANLSPEMQAAMAGAMRGGGRGGAGRGSPGAAGPTGSAWEKGDGWILSFTVVATEAASGKYKILGDVPAEGHSTFTITYKGSIPLNLGSPAAGVPGTPGPIWQHAGGGADVGSAASRKALLTASVVTESSSDSKWQGDCTMVDPGTKRTKMRGSGEGSVPITEIRPELVGTAMFKISADLKTYDLLMGVSGPKVKEITQVHEETGAACPDKKVSIKDTPETKEAGYTFSTDWMKGLPLPATASPISGTKKVQIRFGDRRSEIESTVTWTLTPMR